MTAPTPKPRSRPYRGRSPLGIDILKRGAGYVWRVRSRNKLVIYERGRHLVRQKALAAAVDIAQSAILRAEEVSAYLETISP